MPFLLAGANRRAVGYHLSKRKMSTCFLKAEDYRLPGVLVHNHSEFMDGLSPSLPWTLCSLFWVWGQWKVVVQRIHSAHMWIGCEFSGTKIWSKECKPISGSGVRTSAEMSGTWFGWSECSFWSAPEHQTPRKQLTYASKPPYQGNQHNEPVPETKVSKNVPRQHKQVALAWGACDSHLTWPIFLSLYVIHWTKEMS